MSEEREPPRRRTRRQASDEVRAKPQKAHKKDHAGDKTEIVMYDAENWEETTDGIRRLMKTIESKMADLEARLKRLMRKYEEVSRLKRLVDGNVNKE